MNYSQNNNRNIKDVISVTSADLQPLNKNDEKCAPGIKFEDGSCIRLSVLINIVDAYNLEQNDNHKQIKMYTSLEIINPKKYKRYLVASMNKVMNNESHSKWLEHDFVIHITELNKLELQKYTHRPTGPNDSFEWLNTFNIDDTMGQYENKYKEFKWLGAVPMDFDDLEVYDIKNFNYEKATSEGTTKFGIIFNLDEHYKTGSHWVAMYADVVKGDIYYFDSYGVKPEIRVRKLIRRIARYCQTGMEHKQLNIDYNKQQHQKENSECGVYSINFIVRMLRGDNFNDICMSKIPDKAINKCRNVYFNST